MQWQFQYISGDLHGSPRNGVRKVQVVHEGGKDAALPRSR